MMHESKGQHIGKAMHPYIFFTLQLDSAWESSYNILQVADEAKTMLYYHKSVLTVALLLHISGTT